ncbi:hypothetical protein JTE90_027594 [Oedothorax gibbosus]|uniref:C2H2-type domain-containing protein n=1 Tax=Oedothorax gibbosus TaxID=931172 RepID=A0AAV6VJY1_9ARAC|nr:hypothetical protein JTE90_027594 [Oedothorax gibbosus]
MKREEYPFYHLGSTWWVLGTSSFSAFKSMGPYKCHICSKEMFRKTNFMRHLDTHKDIKEVHTCHVCGSSLSHFTSLSFSNLKPIGPYKCNICSKEVSQKGHLKRHLETHKDVKEVHTCHICGSTQSRSDSLREHLKYKHGIVLPRKDFFSFPSCNLTPTPLQM